MTDRQRYVPTPEEIAAECAKIREGWSEERWERQRTQADRGWMPPVIGTNNLAGTGDSHAES